MTEVNDFSRVGTLRFQDEIGGDFLAPGGELAVSPWVRLRSLEEAARHVDEDKDNADERLKLLFAPGSSLGGARPIASVQAADGSSYLEPAEFLRRSGSLPKEDLKELWSRIVFSIAVSNTDYHLRNHGFLLEKRGWRLSPLIDVNPNPDEYGLSLNIS
ncbi:MAG: HipA domain-containing protein [Spirochaetaceae bacterium]|nr:HipA domain-containing protein [Spirochaetaceae bacterium]